MNPGITMNLSKKEVSELGVTSSRLSRVFPMRAPKITALTNKGFENMGQMQTRDARPRDFLLISSFRILKTQLKLSRRRFKFI